MSTTTTTTTLSAGQQRAVELWDTGLSVTEIAKAIGEEKGQVPNPARVGKDLKTAGEKLGRDDLVNRERRGVSGEPKPPVKAATMEDRFRTEAEKAVEALHAAMARVEATVKPDEVTAEMARQPLVEAVEAAQRALDAFDADPEPHVEKARKRAEAEYGKRPERVSAVLAAYMVAEDAAFMLDTYLTRKGIEADGVELPELPEYDS